MVANHTIMEKGSAWLISTINGTAIMVILAEAECTTIATAALPAVITGAEYPTVMAE